MMTTGQPTLPGTEDAKAPRKKRRSLIEQAGIGDLLLATPPEPHTGVLAVERITVETDGQTILERWKDQGVIDPKAIVEVWESRPGGYYRRKKS